MNLEKEELPSDYSLDDYIEIENTMWNRSKQVPLSYSVTQKSANNFHKVILGRGAQAEVN